MILILAGSTISKIAMAAGGAAMVSGILNHSDIWVTGHNHQSPAHSKKINYISNANQWRRFSETNEPVVLDIEKWKYTPIEQQRNPVKAYQQFYENLHHVNPEKWIIATPSFNLVKTVFPHYHGKLYQKFIQTNLAGGIAHYVNGYEVQAQWAERTPLKYKQVIQKIAEQVHAVNPSVMIFAGLSTNPSPQKISSSILEKDIEMTRSVVDGYWLNVPSNKTYCRSCGTPQPEKAIKLIQFIRK